MRAPLAVIASLLVSPALGFENLIIDSTVQYPVEVTGQAPSWSDIQTTPVDRAGNPVQSRSSVAIPNLAVVPNLAAIPNLSAGPNLIALPSAPAIPNLAVAPNLFSGPNLFPEASSQGAQVKVPGNYADAQVATASSSTPQSSSSGLAAAGSPSAVSAVSPVAGTQASAASPVVSPTTVAPKRCQLPQ